MEIAFDGYRQLQELRNAIAERLKGLVEKPKIPEIKDAADALKQLDRKLASLQDGARAELGLGPLNRELTRLMVMAESGDERPSDTLRAAAEGYCTQLQQRLAQWRENHDAIAAVASLLQKYSLAPLPAEAKVPEGPVCGK
jgi:hypothetical protein